MRSRRRGRPVGQVRGERAVEMRSGVKGHQEVKVRRREAQERPQIVRLMVLFSEPTSAAGPPHPIPPPKRNALLDFIIADFSVFELSVFCQGPTGCAAIHAVVTAGTGTGSLLSV